VQKKKKDGKEIKQHKGFKIASMNIKGRYLTSKTSKYKILSTIIRKNQIDVIGLQETKLKTKDEEELNLENPKMILISNPAEDGNAKAGTAFILNKDKMKNKTWTHTILIQGRLSVLTFKNTETQTFNIINLYSPNDLRLKKEFYKRVLQIISSQQWENPILIGDFNMVEQAIDRLPEHQDDNALTKRVNQIINKLEVVDGWRKDEEEAREYTYSQKTPFAAARIDRIYVAKQIIQMANDWHINETYNLSDHRMVTVTLTQTGLPEIYKGLWRLGSATEQLPAFRKRIKKLLDETNDNIVQYLNKYNSSNEEEKQALRMRSNPQTIWQKTKERINEISIEETKLRNAQINRPKNKITKKIHKLTRLQRLSLRTETQEKIESLREALNDLLYNNTEKLQWAAKARYSEQGEANTKYWYQMNKETKSAQYIEALKDKSGVTHKNTEEMSEIATEYHQELQTPLPMTASREAAITEILNNLKTKLNEEQHSLFEQPISKDEIKEALSKAENGKSPGKDGLPYEFYKTWAKEEVEGKTNIVDILYYVFLDIFGHGTHDKDFTVGVMTLLYKKKDKQKIENYRPITLLNTDYKTMTRAIAKKLGKVAPFLIHPDQAGFVPGRSLFDHTRQTTLMIDYCETVEINGCIIALDQEKAYDKIAHDYLWKTIEKFNFPSIFINLIKTLYSDVRTHVMVNGMIPEPIQIGRGVRQGDPMACLLYDLAIEPLAASIRCNEKIKGITVPGHKEPIKISVFADDTLIYTTTVDDIDEIDNTIKLFCLASTAKFNEEKTEFLPIGKKEYRINLITTRKINESYTIPPERTIIQEGSPMRTLGAWVGNHINLDTQWKNIIDQQQKIIKAWKTNHLSFRGKELILKSLVHSRALFLATVCGMPKNIENQVMEITKDFLWDGRKRGLITMDQASRKHAEGGLGIPDISARLEAIEIVWLKKWLESQNRPAWAALTDEILRLNVTPAPHIEPRNKISWLLQSWHESQAKSAKIPNTITRMLKVARKYNIGIDFLHARKSTINKMPIWHHPAIKNNYLWNKPAAKCLRNKHKIETVEDLETFAFSNKPTISKCDAMDRCYNIATLILAELPPKFQPKTEVPQRDNLEHTPNRIEKYKKTKINKEPIAFNPTTQSDATEPMAMTRIFKESYSYKIRQVNDKRLNLPLPTRETPTSPPRDLLVLLSGSKKDPSMIAILITTVPIKKIIIRTENNENADIPTLIGMIYALMETPNDNITFVTKSPTLPNNILKNIKDYEEVDWLNIDKPKVWKTLIALLRQRGAKTLFQTYNKNHSYQRSLLKKAITTQNPITWELPEYTKQYVQEGAALNTLSQCTAYQIIRSKKSEKIPERTLTRNSVKTTIEYFKRNFGITITEQKLWKSQRKKTIPKNISDFLWKITHNAVKCGKFFANMPTWADKQFCPCNKIESPEHILFECKKFGNPELWKIVENTWTKINKKGFIKPNIDVLKGIGMMRLNQGEDGSQPATNLYTQLILETVWVIWKARNERRITEKTITTKTLIKRWAAAIKNRMVIEWTKINQKPFNKQKLAKYNFSECWLKNNILGTIVDESLQTNIPNKNK
jgi:exonuclease III